jgi:hypothetical protein
MIAPSRRPERAPEVHSIERHPQDGWTLAEPLSVSPASERALCSLVRALLPPPPAPRPADIEARVARHVRSMLQYMPRMLQLGFLLIARLLEFSPLWRLQALSRLSSLPAAQASQILAGIASSRLLPLRLMMLAPKAMVLSTYFDQDEVHAALDYEPRAFFRERIARRNELLENQAVPEDTARRVVRRMEVLP